MEVKPHRTGRDGLPYLRVAILLCRSFTLTAMSGFVDALRLAADTGDRSRQIYFAWEFIAAGPEPIRASCGLGITPTAPLGNPGTYDCAVICGGRLEYIDETAPWVDAFLQEMHRKGRPIAGLCTGSFILARAGLLSGRRCALHFGTAQAFSDRFPDVTVVTDRSHVIDDNILTCPGGVASAWVATLLIGAYSNSTRANKSLSHMLLDHAPPRLSHASPSMKAALERASGLTLRAIDAMEFSIDAPFSIDELSRRLNVSKPSLNRTFAADLGCAPARFWRMLRLQVAKELLATRRRSITEIAHETGFCDAAHLCSAFKREFGQTPRSYRQAH